RKLLAEGASLRAYDPEAMEKTRVIFPQVHYAEPYEVADKADALLIVTEWEQFKKLDWTRVRDSMLRPLVFDGRNLLDPAKMKELGFEYQSIGRPI
ncbi:MAG TPA: UDP binding domain-containing protein, partial [Candidatus Acidoferrum sp.]|nr:UDP binding domain-containing protein [Candidatus Acidoferrum sp.]